MGAAYLAALLALQPARGAGRKVKKVHQPGSSRAEQEKEPVVAAALSVQPYRWKRWHNQATKGRAGTSSRTGCAADGRC